MCVALGVALLAAFVSLELRTPSPLIDVKIFRDRVFLIENVILAIAMMVFVPIFFFASEYAQIALGEDASTASLTLLYFFIGFVVAAQIGGRMLDRRGAKRPIVLGCTLACLGLALWADRVTTLSIGQQIWCIVLAGAGMGLLLGQANTDALNRAPSTAYGEATGITQTVRNYGAGLGLAILGTLSVTRFRSHVKDSLVAKGLDPSEAHSQAGQIANLSGGSSGHSLDTIPDFIRMDFANSTQTVLYAMAAVMGLAGVIALFRLPRHGSSPAKELARAPQQPLQA
jgi:MFS family permease